MLVLLKTEIKAHQIVLHVINHQLLKSAFGDNKVEMKKAQEKLCLSCHLG